MNVTEKQTCTFNPSCKNHIRCVETWPCALFLGISPSPSSHSHLTQSFLVLISIRYHKNGLPHHVHVLLFFIYHGMNAACQLSSKESFKLTNNPPYGCIITYPHKTPHHGLAFLSHHEYYNQHSYKHTFLYISGSLLSSDKYWELFLGQGIYRTQITTFSAISFQ